jgi:hypothetical protein
VVKHVWESFSRGRNWRGNWRGLWICRACGRAVYKRPTATDMPPTDKLLREISIPLDCDEEKVRQIMES